MEVLQNKFLKNLPNSQEPFWAIYRLRLQIEKTRKIRKNSGSCGDDLQINSKSEALFIVRSSCPEVFYKKDVLRNFTMFTGKHLYQACKFIKKETLTQVFSCEFFEISKNTFSYRTPLVAASVCWKILSWKSAYLIHYLCYIIAKNLCHCFSCFKESIIHLSIDFTKKACPRSLYFEKLLLFFSFNLP